jgi:hypothetical protein
MAETCSPAISVVMRVQSEAGGIALLLAGRDAGLMMSG